MRIVRSAERFVTRRPGVVTTHGLSFGEHYDPTRTAFGRLVAHNVEHVAPGHGYDLHQHRGVEIVTWVVEGTLRHTDSTGHSATAPAFAVQCLDAGDRIGHAEVNAAEASAHDADRPAGPDLTFVQLWFAADESADDAEASDRERYAVAEVAESDLRAGPVLLASARSGARVGMRQDAISVYAAIVAGGTAVAMPPAPYLHVYVVRGAVRLRDGAMLEEADSAEIQGRVPSTLHADVDADAHLLIAAMG